MMPPPIPTWRKQQSRLDWHHSQNFDGVAANLRQGKVPRWHLALQVGLSDGPSTKGLDFWAQVSVECAGVRLRESPLPWRRRCQILRAWFQAHSRI